MGINMNFNVKNENEFNQQMQMYLAQGYRIQSNFNGTAILSKKSYSMGLLIVLIIFFFPAAIIYYLISEDNVITISLENGQTTNNSFNDSPSEEFAAYCPNCGHGLFKDSKFCPGCGQNISEDVKTAIEEVPETEEEQTIQCKNCGNEFPKGTKFCSECGENLTKVSEGE